MYPFYGKRLLSLVFLFFPVPFFKNGNFAFTAAYDAANIFLVGEYYQKSYSNGKYTVKVIIYIKNYQYKYREGNTCQYGA